MTVKDIEKVGKLICSQIQAGLEPAEALERLLQNWTFIAILSSELQNTFFVWLRTQS